MMEDLPFIYNTFLSLLNVVNPWYDCAISITPQQRAVIDTGKNSCTVLMCRVPQLMSVLLTEFLSDLDIFSVFVEIVQS